jgi:hypothetical protein
VDTAMPCTVDPPDYPTPSVFGKQFKVKKWRTPNINIKSRVKISLLQAVEALRIARGRGSHVS